MNITIKGQTIKVSDVETLVSNSVGQYVADYSFSSEYSGYSKIFIAFLRDDEKFGQISREVTGLTGEVEIPWEMLADRGGFKIAAYALNGRLRRPTIWSQSLRPAVGVDPEGYNGHTPSDHPYAVLSERIDDLETRVDDKQATLIAGDNITIASDGRTISASGGGAVNSVNGKTGDVVLTASDVGALPDTTTIPTELSQLTADSSHRTVTDAEKSTWSGKQNAISDLATIRSGASAGATALQPSALNAYRTSASQDVIDAGKQDKLIAGANITIAADGKTISASGGGGGTSDHTQLTNRDANNQHPISAVTGLEDALDGKRGKRGVAVVFGDSAFNNTADDPEDSSEFGDYLEEQGIYSEVKNYACFGSGFGETDGSALHKEYSLYNMLCVSSNPHYSEVRQAVSDAEIIYMHLGVNDCKTVTSLEDCYDVAEKCAAVFAEIYELNPAVVIKYMDVIGDESDAITYPSIQASGLYSTMISTACRAFVAATLCAVDGNLKYADIAYANTLRKSRDGGAHPNHDSALNIYEGLVYGGYCNKGKYLGLIAALCVDGAFDTSLTAAYVQYLTLGLINSSTNLLVLYSDNNAPTKIVQYTQLSFDANKVVWKGDDGYNITLNSTGLFKTPTFEPHNYTLDGANLETVFGSAAAFHAAVAAGDFSNIHIGDYWPISLTGDYRDYSEGTSVGEYEEKSFNNAAVYLEVAAINPYWKYGDSGDIAYNTPHVLFVSRDCLPAYYKMRKTRELWEDETYKNPWLGSALYRTLNDSDHGIVNLVKSTDPNDIGYYIYGGSDGNGMRYLGEKRDPITKTSSDVDWFSRGKLFLPTEDEVWGREIFAKRSYLGMKGLPIFDGTRRRIMKDIGNGTGRGYWWVMSASDGSYTDFCDITHDGIPTTTVADNTLGAPLCFLVT